MEISGVIFLVFVVVSGLRKVNRLIMVVVVILVMCVFSWFMVSFIFWVRKNFLFEC